MSQEPLSMRKIREILRLKHECHLSNRAIGRSLRISHSTVAECLRRVRKAGLGWPLPEGLDDDRLSALLYPPPPAPSTRVLPEPNWAHVDQELRHKGVTLQLLWEEYHKAHPEGFRYSRFCERYAAWKKRLEPSMRQTYKRPATSVSSTTPAPPSPWWTPTRARSKTPTSSSAPSGQAPTPAPRPTSIRTSPIAGIGGRLPRNTHLALRAIPSGSSDSALLRNRRTPSGVLTLRACLFPPASRLAQTKTPPLAEAAIPFEWHARRDSNPRPTDSKSGALSG